MEDIVIRVSHWQHPLQIYVDPLQCERASTETSCWLIVAAQHPNASAPFIHWESPRIRRDAKDDAKDIIKRFNMTITSLMNARRQDALEMGKALAEAQKRGEDAEVEAESSRQALKKQESELAAKDAIITKYKMILGRNGD
jgi:predicted short-subunit dehydrogenase-like oxidoreductase (DUF2520 family)